MTNRPTYCPRCGTPVEDVFCPHCGNPLQQSVIVPSQPPIPSREELLEKGVYVLSPSDCCTQSAVHAECPSCSPQNETIGKESNMNDLHTYCPKCGTPVEDAFCPHCGKRVPKKLEPHNEPLKRGMRYCKVCGKTISKKAIECPYCKHPYKRMGFFGFIFKVLIPIVLIAILGRAVFLWYADKNEKKNAEPSSISTYVEESLNDITCVTGVIKDTLTKISCAGLTRPTSTPVPTEPEDVVISVVLPSTETIDPTEVPTEAPEPTPDCYVDGMRPEFKDLMDAYEIFCYEYYDFMDAYKADPDNSVLKLRYQEMSEKTLEWEQKFEELNEDAMNDAETQYYWEVHFRVLDRAGATLANQ